MFDKDFYKLAIRFSTIIVLALGALYFSTR